MVNSSLNSYGRYIFLHREIFLRIKGQFFFSLIYYYDVFLYFIYLYVHTSYSIYLIYFLFLIYNYLIL